MTNPFEARGQSLISSPVQTPFVINYFGGSSYFLMTDDLICVSDGKKPIGFYHATDLNLTHNLIDTLTPKMNLLSLKLHTFLQDYREQIVNAQQFNSAVAKEK